MAPAGLEERTLVAVLADSWGLDVTDLSFVPKGFGSFHWKATMSDDTPYFVTVDDLGTKLWFGANHDSAFAGLRAAFDTAADLHDHAALGFVVAPIRTPGGESVVRITPQYSVGLFPYLEGSAGLWGDELSDIDRRAFVRILADLHSSTLTVASRPPRYDKVLPERVELESALRDIGRPWTGGPYSEPARDKVASAAEDVSGWLGLLDRLAAEAGASNAGLVLTHGEPHPGNIIRIEDRFLLIDWDTVGLAPPERDLWMLDDERSESFRLYSEMTGAPVQQESVAMYRLAWVLKDLAAYLALFRSGHERTEDSEKAWTRLDEVLRRGPEALLAERPPWRSADGDGC